MNTCLPLEGQYHAWRYFQTLVMNFSLSEIFNSMEISDCFIRFMEYFLKFKIDWWVRVGGFSKVVATLNHVGGFFNLFIATTGGVWIIPSFLIRGYVLYVERTLSVITNFGQHQWSISFLISSWGLTGAKHYQKSTIAIIRIVLQHFTIPGYFPYILFYRCLCSLLSSGWFVIAVCDSFSDQGTC